MGTTDEDRVWPPSQTVPALEVDRGFVLLTGIECSAPMVDGRRVDELAKTNHYARAESDLERIRQMGIKHVRYPVPIHIVNPEAGHLDWTFPDRALAACRQLEIEPVLDLLHFGVPDDLHDFQSADLPERFAGYARAVAQRYPWVRYYTPVNEPFITASLSARFGLWNEQRSDEVSFVRALLSVAKCALLGAREIRGVRPDAIFIQSETCQYVHPVDSATIARAELENDLRFTSFELVYGRTLPGVVADHLINHGATKADLDWFERNGSDEGCVVGTDYYATSELELGASGLLRSCGVRLGYYELAHQYFQRLGRPILHSETNAEGADAIDWLRRQWTDVTRLLREGFPIRGFTWYGFVDHVDWDSVLVAERGRENRCGLVDLKRDPNPVHAEFARLVSEVARQPSRSEVARARDVTLTLDWPDPRKSPEGL